MSPNRATTNAVFLGTVGHLAPSISADFTTGMVHAFLTSVLICALAIVCSLMRGGRQHATATDHAEAHSEESAGVRAAGGR